MHTHWHRSLVRVTMLVFAAVLVFDSGILNPITTQLSEATYDYLASVGSSMFASVPPNEINSITAELTKQRRLLDEREANLLEREIAAREFGTDAPDYSTYVISVILFLLTMLLVLNFVMDYIRTHHSLHERKST